MKDVKKKSEDLRSERLKQALEDDIKPFVKPEVGYKDPVEGSQEVIYKHLSLDQFLQYLQNKENIDKQFGNDSGLRITAKEKDIEVIIPRKVKIFCEDNHLSVDQFVNMAFNYFCDILVEGRDRIEFKIAIRIKNCPYIKTEYKQKVLIWCLRRFQRTQTYLWNIIKKESPK